MVTCDDRQQKVIQYSFSETHIVVVNEKLDVETLRNSKARRLRVVALLLRPIAAEADRKSAV